MSNIWFTSDTHFGHANIVRGCSTWPDISNTRDFKTIEEHDDYIIEQINKLVKPTDTLWHLGDVGFGFAWKERIITMRERIKCETIKLTYGNHDHLIEHAFSNHNKGKGKLSPEEAEKIRSLFKDVYNLKFGKIGGRSLVLCHYAMLTWPWQHHGSIQLYGHSHGSLPDNVNQRQLDVGVDTCLYGHTKYTPYCIDEIFHIIDNLKGPYVSIDHHKPENPS